MNVVRDIIVIGAPVGGAAALIEVANALPADLPASVLVVMHSETEKPILLADALSAPRRMRASEAIDGEPLEPSRIYVAADGKHMRVERDRVRVKREPPENECCPSIDVLFRSAAETHQHRVVGVALLHIDREGSSGLDAVRQHGGRTITHRNELMTEAPRHHDTGESLGDHHLELAQIAPRIVDYVYGKNGSD
ncbi:MAG TPA: chemotaxis protein CheB [Chthoniobacterales bacterium]|nr:chemotaxis protein CheB [Chthoniobacterales bacterium]